MEETIDRICHYYGIESGNAFVLSNGIFITSGNEREEIFAKVQHIPVSGVHLNRVAAVNQLSREIVEGRYTIGEVRERLDRDPRHARKDEDHADPGLRCGKRMLLYAVRGQFHGQRGGFLCRACSCIFTCCISAARIYRRLWEISEEVHW